MKTESPGADLAGSGVLAASMALASWVSAGLLSILIALVAGWSSLFMASRVSGGSAARQAPASALVTGIFPLSLLVLGEPGLMWAGALAVICVAVAFLFSRPAGGAVSTASMLIWLPLYIGFGLSYAVLIRLEASGRELLVCAALILCAYKGSTLVGSKWGLASGRRPAAAIPPMLPLRLAGIAAAEVAAMVSLLFLDDRFRPGPLAIIGLVVAMAAMLGEAAGRMIQAGIPTKGPSRFPPWAALDAWVVALPAFFYSFRLYLT